MTTIQNKPDTDILESTKKFSPRTPQDTPPKKFLPITPQDTPPKKFSNNSLVSSLTPSSLWKFEPRTPSGNPPPKETLPASNDSESEEEKEEKQLEKEVVELESESEEEEEREEAAEKPLLERAKERKEFKKASYLPPPKQFDLIMEKFWGQQPYVRSSIINNELEVRFGTKGNQYLTKIDYDNVISKIKSLGFVTKNPNGRYMLRIQNEFLDPSGRFKDSPIRTEINGFTAIQDYCKTNNIKNVISANSLAVSFIKKGRFFFDDTPLYPADFNDYNFRVSFQVEEDVGEMDGRVKGMLNSWERSKKKFRYINRVTFSHPDYPINVDISILKTSYNHQSRSDSFYTTQEAGLFTNRETYEVELEVDNERIGPKTEFDNAAKIQGALRKVIKFILSGLQGTNFPVSYPELKNIGVEYLKIIKGESFEESAKNFLKSKDFIGPSSYTLQIENIAEPNDNSVFPNIRKGYTVTDKADGERSLLIISGNGKIYLMNTNMKIAFSGSQTSKKEYFNTIIDGEIVPSDKNGKFINLYAAFDIYFLNGKDIRTFGFVQVKPEEKAEKLRLPILKSIIRNIEAYRSDKQDEPSPLRIT